MQSIRLSSITLTFENCETMEIPATVLGNFGISEITDAITRLAYNSILKYRVANSVLIEISREALKLNLHSSFEESYLHAEDSDTPRYMQFDDITSISLTYLDESGNEISEEYLVPWENSDDLTNPNQNTLINSNKDTLIVICKDVKEAEETIEYYKEFFFDPDYKVECYDYVNKQAIK